MGAQTGRPTVITPATVRKLEQAFRDGFTVSAACRTSGISTSTYYDHLAVDNNFSDTMALAQDYITHKAKQLVAQEISDGNLRAAQWWLERKAKDEFGINAISDEARRQQELNQHQPDEDDYLTQSLAEIRHFANAAILEAKQGAAAEPMATPVEYVSSSAPLL